jgi:O-antigen/teichoic acid export membrane protein
MGLKRNIVANYLSQGYVAGVGILTVPLYVRYLGTEAYGLIGFYTMLQAWFQLLDTGLSTTLARESSRFNGGSGEGVTLVHLRKVLERAFVAIGAVGAVAFWFGADAVTHRWLKVGALPLQEVTRSVQLMGVVIAARWLSCLYRGVVAGFEKQVWLGSFNVGVATARFVVCLPVMLYIGATPTVYFAYQAAVALAEALGLLLQTNTLLPRTPAVAQRVRDLRSPLRFASGVAFTSVVWVLVTQADKLLLSKLLPLSDYGTFSLAVLLAGGINLLAGPIGLALLPRLTNTAAAADESGLRKLYSYYSQVTCLATFPAALTLYACAMPVLLAWTGNAELARTAAPILGLYSLGNAVMNLTAYAYYIQYARGNIRFHLIGNAIFAVIYLPAVLAAARMQGAPGAALAWLAMNVLYLVGWVPLIHRRLVPGLHGSWLRRDILPIVIGSALPALLMPLVALHVLELRRWQAASVAAAYFVVSLACAAAGSSIVRARVRLALERHPAAA